MLYYVHGKVNASREDIQEALTGKITDHHGFMMPTLLNSMARTKSNILEVERRINALMEPYKQVKELLETIPGV